MQQLPLPLIKAITMLKIRKVLQPVSTVLHRLFNCSLIITWQ